jgi:hypothetical protein
MRLLYFKLQPYAAWTVGLMDIVTRGDVSATRDGLVTAVTCSHVILGAQNMVSARMEHVSVLKAGMANIAPYVSKELSQREFYFKGSDCGSSHH